MKGPRESQRWGNKRVQFQEPYNKMSKPSREYGTSSGAWKPVVPFWEREFCESVGLTWNQVCDNNNELEGFERVLQWDDLAGFEAFRMAKQRYWANRNGLPCEIPLPSPDLYIDEVDWNANEQEDCDLPDRNNSSSEEEHKRPYIRRGTRGGYQGRRKNVCRVVVQEQRPSDRNASYSVNMSEHVGWPNSDNNACKDPPGWKKKQGSSTEMTGAIDWSENRQNATEISKVCAKNQEINMGRTGWGDHYQPGWDVKQTEATGWEIQETNDVSPTGWEPKEGSEWNSHMAVRANCFVPENAMETSTGWGNQTEPTRNSTVTSKTGWTDSGNAAGTSNGWEDQVENGWNTAAACSGWTTNEDDKYTSLGWGNEKGYGWNSKTTGGTGWTSPGNATGWEDGTGWVAPFMPQEQVVNSGWGEQFPGPVHSQYQDHSFMVTQWNSMSQGTPQWQSQPATWNQGPAGSQHQFNSNWGGPSLHTHQQGGSPGWFQPPSYSQSSWHPINSNQGHWHPQSQYKQGSYAVTNRQYAQKKHRDYRINNRHNQR